MIQEKGKRRARRAPALLAAYLALALLAGCAGGAGSSAAEQNSASSVSYTHLDVYKRQSPRCCPSCTGRAPTARRCIRCCMRTARPQGCTA